MKSGVLNQKWPKRYYLIVKDTGLIISASDSISELVPIQRKVNRTMIVGRGYMEDV